MKITASEIRQKTFEKNFRGYDKDEVTAFLNSLSEAWEQLIEEKRDLERKLEYSEKEANRLKNVEDSLFRTLKTAEDTGAIMIEDANRAAEEIMQDAQVVTEALYNDAKTKSKNLIETAEAKGQEILENLKADVTYLTNSFENLILQRDHLINNLQKLAANLQLDLSSSKGDFEKIDLTVHQDILEKLAKSDGFTLANINTVNEEQQYEKSVRENPIVEDEIAKDEIASQIESQPHIEEQKEETTQEIVADNQTFEEEPEQVAEVMPSKKTDKGGSFFDQLD